MNSHLHFLAHKLICLCAVLMKFVESESQGPGRQLFSLQPGHLVWRARAPLLQTSLRHELLSSLEPINRAPKNVGNRLTQPACEWR